MIVTIPNSLSPASILAFAAELDELPPADLYEFDFGRGRWFPPFSMLLLAIILKRFRDARPDCRCRARNHENHTYAAHLGFFRSFGLQHGNAPGAAPGSDNYVPITALAVEEIRREAADRWIEVGDVIEGKARELAGVLTRTDQGALFDTLSYSIREIIRNTVEHSEAPELLICAQYWPSRNEVEVGIADAGIGIMNSLRRNPSFAELDERQAVQTALMPGVSGNPLAGTGSDVWQNSGYGLYMTNRICRSGGKFMICSGHAGIQLTATNKTDLEGNLPGTAIRLLINTNRLTDLREQLQRFHEEGRRAAQTIRGANRNFASTASQMLSVDFQSDQIDDDF
ncbi:hypothetical protein GQE99_20570 [Maritimibacter sp. DP07]|uniref:Histidine kinase-, DNA gyrase B-, and HSP90-like ATPase n=1 Tax=Maritimibacter harenae TaxID=2606218 RepID=A0A845MBS6_9RHOB|nr:sensor histidine kinase [Maritimibacter harenae]MZR15414.1 hypothetical protein [Maritimibacter harenae]